MFQLNVDLRLRDDSNNLKKSLKKTVGPFPKNSLANYRFCKIAKHSVNYVTVS